MGLYTSAVLVSSVLGCCSSFDLPRNHCADTINIDGEHYNNTETLHLGDAYPSDAHYDVYGNLFYVQTGRNLDGYFFDVYVIKFKTNSPVKIHGLPDSKGYSVAVDKKETQVYFGTEEGIFRYDYESDSATSYGATSERINLIFVDSNSNIYVTKPNDGLDELYLLENDKTVPISNVNVLSDMGISDRNDMYFIQGNELFVLKNGNVIPKLIMYLDYSGTGQISFDGKGTVYIATDKLRYFHPEHSDDINSVTIAPGEITALAFNSEGGFVLGLYEKIMKFEKVKCYFRY